MLIFKRETRWNNKNNCVLEFVACLRAQSVWAAAVIVCVSEVMWIVICWVQSLDTTGGRRGRGTVRSSGNIYIGTHHTTRALKVSTNFRGKHYPEKAPISPAWCQCPLLFSHLKIYFRRIFYTKIFIAISLVEVLRTRWRILWEALQNNHLGKKLLCSVDTFSL